MMKSTAIKLRQMETIIRKAYASKISVKEKDGSGGWMRMSPTVFGIWTLGPQVMTLSGDDLSGAASVEEIFHCGWIWD